MDLIPINNSISKLLDNESSYLAINTNFNNKSLKGAARASLRNAAAYIFHPDKELLEWRITGMLELENRIYFYGPWLEGSLLADIKNLARQDLLNLIFFLAELEKRDIELDLFSLNSFYLCSDASWLCFPPALMSFLAEQSSAEQQYLFIPYNNDKLQGAQKLSFALGVFLYKLLSNKFPYEGRSEEDIKERLAISKAVGIELRLKNIPIELAGAINNAIQSSAPLKIPSFQDWQRILAASDLYAYAPVDQAELLANIAKIQAKIDGHVERIRFWRKWRLVIAVSISAFVLLVAFLYGPIKKNFAAPLSDAFTRREIVEAYYTLGMNDLDIEWLDSLTVGKDPIVKSDKNIASHLFISTRVQRAYEGASQFINAQSILDKSAKLGKDSFMIGVTNIEIEKLADGDFSITYIFWLPSGFGANNSDIDNIDFSSTGYKRRDKLSIVQKDENWFINKIEREELGIINSRDLELGID